MVKNIQKISYALIFACMLSACQGDTLFRTKPCDDGMIRQGSACVAATSGVRDCKDPDLNKVQKGESVTLCDGSLGEGKLVFPSDCTQDGEQNCVAKTSFKVVNTNNLSSTDIKDGKVVAGITGSLRGFKQCRNYSALATFDSSYPPSNLGWNSVTFAPAAVNTGSDQLTFTNAHGLITNSPVRFTTTTTLPAPLVAGTTYYAIYVSNTVIQVASTVNGTQIDITTQGTGTHTAHDVGDSTAQYYDTIDDYNNNQASGPANNPWSSGDYLCDSSNFVNVTSSSAPLLPSGLTPPTGNQPFTQIWQDQISGIYISNILTVPAGRRWSDAVRTCEFLNGSTAGEGWRLPTQKELMQLYIHGLSKVVLAGGSTNAWFWSSSGASDNTDNAWYVYLSNGATDNMNRLASIYSALCVR